LKLPKRMQADFSRHVQALADETSRELNAADIWGAFEKAYALDGEYPFGLIDYQETHAPGGIGGANRMFVGKIKLDGEERSISGRGNGLISSVLAALRDECGIDLEVADYSEHAIGHGSDAQAAAYVECRTPEGRTVFGVGVDADVATASVRAVLSAANGIGAVVAASHTENLSRSA
ncbi:MAG: alpha-isopropylmalate synthase regulatory domain-containing protein, partial [Sphingomonadaceae bacterium]